jgi:hypothetical protein
VEKSCLPPKEIIGLGHSVGQVASLYRVEALSLDASALVEYCSASSPR